MDNNFLDPILKCLSSTRDISGIKLLFLKKKVIFILHKDSAQVKFKMGDVILPPNQLINYYRYIGSLTTSPCTEGVFWTIFESPISISKNQVL